MVLLLFSKYEKWLELYKVNHYLTNIGVNSSIQLLEQFPIQFENSCKYKYFFIRSNIQEASSIYYYLCHIGVRPINSGAFLFNFNRINVKATLQSIDIKTPRFSVVGKDYKDIDLGKSYNNFIVKDYTGQPHKPTYNLHDSSMPNSDCIVYYVEQLIDNGFVEYKIYAIGDKIFISANDDNNAKECGNLNIIKVVKKISESFNLVFFSIDIFIKEEELIVFDVNQNPSFYYINNPSKIIADTIKKLINS